MPNIEIAVIDCLTAGDGKRIFTRDFIGAGPRYIAGFIEDISQKMISTTIIRGEKFLQLSDEIIKKFPIICISAMTMDLGICQKIITKWIKIHPVFQKRFALLGGPISSDVNIIDKLKVDIMVQGEGEVPLKKLFHDNLNIIKDGIFLGGDWKNKIKQNTKNFQLKGNDRVFKIDSWAKENQIIFKNTSGYPEKIEYYSDFEFSRVFVECLRGCSNFRRTSLRIASQQECSDSLCEVCRKEDFTTLQNCPSNIPAGCGFCSTISDFGSPKSREIEVIITEIKTLINLGVHRIVLGGPGFLDFHREKLVDGPLINPKTPEPNYAVLKDFIEKLIEIPEISKGIVQLFIENIKATLCTNLALDIISKIPHCIFSIGCETGSLEFSNILGRPGSPHETYDAVSRAIARKIRVHVYFIHSLPGDTEIFTQDTLGLLKKFSELGVDKITLYKYQELPASPFYKISKQYRNFDKKTLKMFDRIKKFSINYNKSQKERLLGQVVKVLLSEKNSSFPNDAIGWMLQGGPKISISNAVKMIGEVRDVRIIRVLSDRFVLGELI